MAATATTASPKPAAASGRIPELDGLRAVAILAVVAFHYTSDNFPITSAGWTGVDLFFVISGYLITSILLGSRERRHYFGNFYARRALRIFPPFYLQLLVLMAAGAYLGGPKPAVWAMFFSYTYSLLGPVVQGWGLIPAFVYVGLRVTWSLSIEEVFYLIWAPVVKLFQTRWLTIFLLAVLAIEPPLRLLLASRHFDIYDFFPIRLDGLAFGALTAIWLRGTSRARAVGIIRRLAPFAAVALLATLIMAQGGDAASTGFLAFGYTLLAFGSASAVAACVIMSGHSAPPLRILRSPAMMQIGKTSYVLYLIHYPVRVVVQSVAATITGRVPSLWAAFQTPHDPPRIETFVLKALVATVSFAISLALAQLSWRYFETPILRFKDRRAPALAVAAAPPAS